ncbi:MAG: GNAT family N-acetyltransferase [Bacteroidales bacterium]|nr:GNAT family N-acetyltransferase [Bacteroidales bacterium]
MKAVRQPVSRNLILKELTKDKFIRSTRKGGNYLYEVTAKNSPYTMQEIGRLREISFRLAGGGTGKSVDIDDFDTDAYEPYKQLIVWDPKEMEILGGYRYIDCGGLPIEKMATKELFSFSDEFKSKYLPFTIELGRSFIQPNYQSTNLRRKSLYALDNLWDGLGALVVRYSNIKYFFGKVTMYTSYNIRARNLLMNFLSKYFHDDKNLVRPIKSIDCDLKNPFFVELYSNLNYHEAYKVLLKEIKNHGEHIPPLINSYMKLSPSMKVFGTSVNEGFGGVEETGILVNIKDIYPEKIERHIKPLIDWAQKIKVKWWRKKDK